MDELKPCPFCGGEAGRSMGKTNDGKDWPYIECIACDAMAEPEDWNNRVIDIKNERLREALEYAHCQLVNINAARKASNKFEVNLELLEQALKGE